MKALIAFAVLLCAAACEYQSLPTHPSQPEPNLDYTLDGVVRSYPSNDLISGATVTFQGKSAMSDDAGTFRIAGLSPGGDQIVVSKPGFITNQQILTIGRNQAEYHVTLFMAPQPQ